MKLNRFISQPGKKPIDLIVDFLTHLWEYAKQQITREIGSVADLSRSSFPAFSHRSLISLCAQIAPRFG